jgi:dihydroneopterin aldolase
MKLTTALENLSFHAYHGLYAHEREKGGTFIVTIKIDQEVPEHREFKRIEELINYEEIHKIIVEEMEIPREFIEDLARTILQRISNLLIELEVAISVKITKPDPAGLFGSGEASVTLAL